MFSSSCGTINSTRYYHESWLNDSAIGDVQVRSRIVKGFALGSVVHHYITVNGIDGKWRVFQWTNGDGIGGWTNMCAYAAQTLRNTHYCHSLGRHSVKDIYQAAKEASYGRSYSYSYNCNDWVENLASKLGRSIAVHWNCSCVF